VLSFIDRINHTDRSGLVQLMTDDHRVRVLTEAPLIGREANERAWRGDMTTFPEYVVHPRQLTSSR
jgi:hypothetical protein